MSLWSTRWFLVHFAIAQLQIQYIGAVWPATSLTTVQLLGLFPDDTNATNTTEMYAHARAMFHAAIMLSHKYGIKIDGQPIGWKSSETGSNVIDTLSTVCDAVSSFNIVGIVGPPSSREAALVANFGRTVGIPVISYAATASDLSDRATYPNLFRTVPSDKAAASAIASLFRRFNWTSCVVISQNDEYGESGARVLEEVFLKQSLLVRKHIVFDVGTLKIEGDLKELLMKSTARIVLLWTQSNCTPLILQQALDIDVLGPRFTWILTSSVSLTSFDQRFHEKLIGLLVIESIPGSVANAPTNETLLTEAYDIWKGYDSASFPQSKEANSYGLFAFDATWALIQSLQQFCSATVNQSISSCTSFTKSSSCFHRHFLSSNALLNTLTSLEFTGITGPVRFGVNGTDRITGIYYHLQNIQLSLHGIYFVPVLQYDDLHGWTVSTKTSIIIWPGNSFIKPTGRAVLDGVTLRIGVINSPPFTIVSNTSDASGTSSTKLTGYMIDVIELLRNKMGFIADIQLAAANQTYSEFIQAVAEGDYDIAVGDVTVTASRRELVDFSSAIFDNSLRIVMRRSAEAEVELLAFLKPFSRRLWLLVLIAFVYAAILLCLLERVDNEALQNRSVFSQLIMSMWYSYGSIVGYGVDYNVTTAAGRVLTAALYMLSLVLVASYTANLASDLTIAKSKEIISDVNDLKSGKIPFNRIGIVTDSASEQYYLNQISSGSRNFHPLKTRQELYDSLLSGIIDVSFLNVGPAEYVTNNVYCNLSLVGTEFYKSIYGIVTPKEWIYAHDLDATILLMRESGELDGLKVKWFQSKLCPDTAETATAMEIESMGGLFLTFSIVTSIAVIVFVFKKRRIFTRSLFTLARRQNCLFQKRHVTKNKTELPIPPSVRVQV